MVDWRASETASEKRCGFRDISEAKGQVSSILLTMRAVQRPSTLIECGFPIRLGMIRRLKDGLAWALMKGVASCDMLRVGACSLRSGDTLMGLPAAGDTCSAPKVGEGTS